MSVLVKGIEIPTSCLSCPLQGGTADCRLTQKTYNWGLTERPSDCPLIEVSEDVQPLEYGEWTAEGNDEYGNYWDECTACRKAAWFPPFVKNDYKYCPHCGARMDGGDA